MTSWTVEQYGTVWTAISGIELDHITEELNGHEEAAFSLPNNAANRTLVGTTSTVRVKYDDTVVFTGVLYGAEYSLKKLTTIVYNDVIERFRRGVITGAISFPDDATDILNVVNNYSSGTIAVGTCPTTPNITLNIDYSTCLEATKAIAESLNMDWWGDTVKNLVGYIHIGTKGATSSVGTVTEPSIISSRVIDRAKNRDKVYVIGTDEDGNRLVGTAGEGSDAAVYTHSGGADQTTLDNIASQKLTELNQDNSGVSLKVLSSVAYNLHSGDVLTVQTTQFNLDDDFRIQKIDKGPQNTTIELDRKKTSADAVLQQQQEVVGEISKKVLAGWDDLESGNFQGTLKVSGDNNDYKFSVLNSDGTAIFAVDTVHDWTESKYAEISYLYLLKRGINYEGFQCINDDYDKQMLFFQSNGGDGTDAYWYRDTDNRRLAVFRSATQGIKGYLTEEAGNMYIDGSYETFSPKLADTKIGLIAQLKKEIEKPYVPRNKENKIMCEFCNKPRELCTNPEHQKTIEKTYGHNISLMAIGTTKLVIDLQNDLEKLKEKIKKLEEQKDSITTQKN